MMVERLEQTGATLVCSDLYIIDAQSNKKANSITNIRKRHIFREGSGLAKYLVVSNFVTGCTMMMQTEIAKKAMPFEPLLVHDHWLAIVASLNGNIELIRKPLVGYRQHGNNQTGVLMGVTDKASYYYQRVQRSIQSTEALSLRLTNISEVQPTLKSYIEWLLARKSYFLTSNLNDARIMYQNKQFGRDSITLEILLPIIPNFVFKHIIKLAKKGVL